MTCIAPRCPEPRQPGSLFCRTHEGAPPAQRGGWLSAERRRRKMAASPTTMDVSNIVPRLWVGAQPPFDRDLPDFDMLVLCAEELQPPVLAFHGVVVRCPIPDSALTVHHVARVASAGRRVGDALSSRRRVLVTCRMGINRAALVASIALAFVTRSSADELIAIMRSRRHPQALTNPYFQHILQRVAGTGRAPHR